MTSPLQRALEAMAVAGIDLAPDELLDVLLLAARLPGGPDAPLPAALDAESARGRGGRGPWRRPLDTRPDGAPAGDGADGADELPAGGPALPLHSGARVGDGEQADGEGRSGSRAVRVPEGKALRDDLLLGRALRPLKRRRDSPSATELDESATASAWADTGMPVFVLRPRREPWLRCTVVVDDGVSMLLWRRLVVELDQLLARIGGFRQMRVLGLRGRGPGEIRLRTRPFAETGPLRLPEAAADPTGRTLLLVVTDGAGAAWRDGRMREVLDKWARCGPTAIVHTLPRRMWPGSGVSGSPQSVRSGRAGSPNTAWTLPGDPRGARTTPVPVPVPVVELSPASVADWAGLVGGYREEAALVLWDDERRPPRAAAAGRARPALERFHRAASPGAHRLAAHLAVVAPLSVPVMRLVQSALPEGEADDPAALAEVFLGGLMHPVRSSPHEPDGVRAPAHHRRFDFPDEVKEALLEAVPTAELLAVRRRVTGRLKQLAGNSPDFPAWLGGTAAAAPGEDGTPFAWASGDLLTRLGGDPAAGAATALLAEPAGPVLPEEPVQPAPPEAVRDPYGLDSHGDVPRPYFFLSYAHTPPGRQGQGAPAHWVEVFYRDLCAAVLQLADLPAGAPLGFMDVSMHQGDHWAQRISAELAGCRVFVPLYSPRYFASLSCGQEWYTFSRRQVLPVTGDVEAPAGIVPVLWQAMGRYVLPEAARRLPADHESVGSDYAADGLYSLIKLTYLREAYESAVGRLARRIVDTAERTVIPVGRRLDFSSQPSAFQPAAPTRQLRILVFSLRRDELPPGRSPQCYGPRRTDWQPYRGLAGRSLAEHTVRLAGQLGFDPVVQEFDEAVEEIIGGGVPAAPAVLLLDSWALLDERRRALLRRFDRSGAAWVSVLEPWSPDDPDNIGRESELRRLGDRTLPGRRREGRPSFHSEVAFELTSRGDFDDALPRAVTRARYAHLEELAAAGPPGPSGPRRPSLRPPFSVPAPQVDDDDTGDHQGDAQPLDPPE